MLLVIRFVSRNDVDIGHGFVERVVVGRHIGVVDAECIQMRPGVVQAECVGEGWALKPCGFVRLLCRGNGGGPMIDSGDLQTRLRPPDLGGISGDTIL